MNFPQQLEDKKKEVYNSDIWKEIIDAGIEEKTEIEYKKILNVKVGSKEYNELDDETKAILISIKKAEIAILEQAIAEMQKQRQEEIEFLENIKKLICKVTPEMQLDNEILKEICPEIFYYCENRLEKLNQPKTEK